MDRPFQLIRRKHPERPKQNCNLFPVYLYPISRPSRSLVGFLNHAPGPRGVSFIMIELLCSLLRYFFDMVAARDDRPVVPVLLLELSFRFGAGRAGTMYIPSSGSSPLLRDAPLFRA
jgi:hypothetical protein